MTADASGYRWSSFRAKVGEERNRILDLDQCYLGFSKPMEQYRLFVEQGITPDEYDFLKERLTRNQLTVQLKFIDEVERRTGLRIEARGQGRAKTALK